MSDGVKRPALQARPLAEALLTLIRPHLTWGEIAGSLRREKAEVGDIEIVATALPSYLSFLDSLVQQGTITKALYGEKQTTRWGEKYRGLVYQGMKAEIFLCDDWNRGYMQWLRTGPGNQADNANMYLVTKIKHGHAPFRVKDGYVYAGEERLKIATEEAWFEICGLPFIEPKNRSVKAYAKLFGARHQWGDPGKYKIRQQRMFDLRGLEAPITGAGSPPKDKPERPPFVWSSPFLRADGKVWVHVGYGDYEPLELTSDRARAYWDKLNRMPDKWRIGEAKRVKAYVDLHDAQRQRAVYADVLAQALEVLRG